MFILQGNIFRVPLSIAYWESSFHLYKDFKQPQKLSSNLFAPFPGFSSPWETIATAN